MTAELLAIYRPSSDSIKMNSVKQSFPKKKVAMENNM
jgi:hypothetical protein